MSNTTKTVIVTGGSQGIGAGTVKAFLNRDRYGLADFASVLVDDVLALANRLKTSFARDGGSVLVRSREGEKND